MPRSPSLRMFCGHLVGDETTEANEAITDVLLDLGAAEGRNLVHRGNTPNAIANFAEAWTPGGTNRLRNRPDSKPQSRSRFLAATTHFPRSRARAPCREPHNREWLPQHASHVTRVRGP